LADAWLPGAARVHIEEEDGGHLKGGAPRAVWHTTGTEPHLVSARSAAQALCEAGRSVHLVWNPLSGEVVQMAPATRAARLLAGEAVREGRVCVHVAVIALSRHPFTEGPLRGVDAIMEWLDSWRIARQWPSGPPLPSPQDHLSPRSRRTWARGGHYGASQIPGSDDAGPGGIDIARITGPHTPGAGVPRPRIPAVRPAAWPTPEARPEREAPRRNGIRTESSGPEHASSEPVAHSGTAAIAAPASGRI
jgi:hypothetical protein